MPAPVTIVLLGRPVPGNERKRTVNGIRFLPKRQADALAALKVAASEVMQNREMLDGPLAFELLAEMPIPTTWSKKKQAAALRGELLPTVRPDLKNILWLSEDALTSIVYSDDKLICSHRNRKRYGVQPKLIITVSNIETR